MIPLIFVWGNPLIFVWGSQDIERLDFCYVITSAVFLKTGANEPNKIYCTYFLQMKSCNKKYYD